MTYYKWHVSGNTKENQKPYTYRPEPVNKLTKADTTLLLELQIYLNMLIYHLCK